MTSTPISAWTIRAVGPNRWQRGSSTLESPTTARRNATIGGAELSIHNNQEISGNAAIQHTTCRAKSNDPSIFLMYHANALLLPLKRVMTYPRSFRVSQKRRTNLQPAAEERHVELRTAFMRDAANVIPQVIGRTTEETWLNKSLQYIFDMSSLRAPAQATLSSKGNVKQPPALHHIAPQTSPLRCTISHGHPDIHGISDISASLWHLATNCTTMIGAE